MTILLVDDDASVRESLGQCLRERDHRVLTCRDGREALDRVESTTPNLVLCDLQMPGMNGFEVVSEIDSRFPGIPVALMTAERDIGAVLTGFRSGAFDYLRKPIDLAELLACIDRVASQNQKVRQQR